MLKLRIISAVILIPCVVFGILYLPSTYVAVASAIVFALAAWEWINMTAYKNSITKYIILILLGLVAFSVLQSSVASTYLYWFSILFWLLGFLGICYFPRGANLWRPAFLQPFVGLIMFVPAWVALNQMHASTNNGPVWVLLACCLIWGADIGAYFSGRLWGKTKLAPHVSPGKTVAGFIGALVVGCVVMTLFYTIFKPDFSYYFAIWLSLVTVLFSVLGDLVESLQKRLYGVKDSGNLIPGHGGVYDRIDSMLAAFPVYVLGMQIIINLRIMAL